MAFLCTRVKSPDEDEYKKTIKGNPVLCCTRELKLTIDPREHPTWLVDSSYGVHPDMKSHSGIYMTLGMEDTYTASTKQKLNTNSLTEA